MTNTEWYSPTNWPLYWKNKYSLQLSSGKMEIKVDLFDTVMTEKLSLNIKNIRGKSIWKIHMQKEKKIKVYTELQVYWDFFQVEYWIFFSIFDQHSPFVKLIHGIYIILCCHYGLQQASLTEVQQFLLQQIFTNIVTKLHIPATESDFFIS